MSTGVIDSVRSVLMIANPLQIRKKPSPESELFRNPPLQELLHLQQLPLVALGDAASCLTQHRPWEVKISLTSDLMMM